MAVQVVAVGCSIVIKITTTTTSTAADREPTQDFFLGIPLRLHGGQHICRRCISCYRIVHLAKL